MQIIFPKGLPGFENYKKFELREEQDVPLAYLNSLDNKNISFALLKPYIAVPDYLTKIEISSDEVEILGIKDDDKVDIWVILTLRLSDMTKTTANLRAPIVINPTSGRGIQIILEDEKYSSKEPIFKELAASQGEDCREGAIG
ncbi:MAG: flagellar assembly protein FliW [Bacillota bacterium]